MARRTLSFFSRESVLYVEMDCADSEDMRVSDEDELSITTRRVDDRSWGQVPKFEV
jgi:hypothetical protein